MPGQMKQKITIKGCQNTINGQLTVQAITLVPIMQEAATKRSTDEGKIIILYSKHKINAEPLNIAKKTMNLDKVNIQMIVPYLTNL